MQTWLYFFAEILHIVFCSKKNTAGFFAGIISRTGDDKKMYIKISKEVEQQYRKEVEQILNNKDFQKLRYYKQHNWSDRLMHSINVSYLSWLMARRLGCDAKAAARAGLLHDFCLYDFHEKSADGERQAFLHPKVAAENSMEHFDISEKERDAILSHMFPLGPLPKSREAWLITIADKVCAAAELCSIAIALARHGKVSFVQAPA